MTTNDRSALADRRATLATALELFKAYRNRYELLPDPSSVAASEIANQEQGRDGEPWGEAPAVGALMAVQTAALATYDHLVTLERVCEPPSSVLGHYVATRATLEAAGRLRWLSEPGIGLRERVRRNLTLHTRNIHQGIRDWQQVSPPDSNEFTSALHAALSDLLQRADAMGIDLEIPEDELGRIVTPPGQGVTSARLVENLNARADYAYLSEVVHSFPPIVSSILHRATHYPDGSMSADPLEVESNIDAALDGFAAAFEGFVAFFGWDETPLEGWQDAWRKVL